MHKTQRCPSVKRQDGEGSQEERDCWKEKKILAPSGGSRHAVHRSEIAPGGLSCSLLPIVAVPFATGGPPLAPWPWPYPLPLPLALATGDDEPFPFRTECAAALLPLAAGPVLSAAAFRSSALKASRI